MFRLTLPLLCLVLPLDLALAGDGKDLEGPLTYRSSGVELDGVRVSWGQIQSLTETDPDWNARRVGHQKKLGAIPRTAAGYVGLGKWCRGQRLMPEAVAAFEKALELEPDNAYARKALGFMQVKGAWADARRVLTERLAVLSANDHGKRVELADFCREHSLFPEEHKLLVEVLAADARHRGAIRRIERILARRSPRTPLSPPFEGRWIGWVDTSRHHKAKVFALFAIDFLRVDQRNEPFAGRRARSTADYHGFGAKIYAAAPGKVIQAEGGHPDMRLGRMGGFDKANSVTIRHASGECTTYGHLKQGSVKVKVGQAVRRGQLLGQVGNSGRSGTPHLHFAMMVPAYDSKGRGVYLSVPYRFASFELVRAGRAGCQIQVKSARPQEGWVIVCPKPESEAQQSK